MLTLLRPYTKQNTNHLPKTNTPAEPNQFKSPTSFCKIDGRQKKEQEECKTAHLLLARPSILVCKTSSANNNTHQIAPDGSAQTGGLFFRAKIVSDWKYQRKIDHMKTRRQQIPTNADFARAMAQIAELSVLVTTACVLCDCDPDGDAPRQYFLGDALAERILDIRLQLASDPVFVWCKEALEETQTTETSKN